jgi:hypothetical protein
MAVLLNIIIGLTLTVSGVIFVLLIKSTLSGFLRKSKRIPQVNNAEPADIEKFNCRAILEEESCEDKNGDEDEDLKSFKLEICGTIHAPEDRCETTAKVFVSDITEGLYKASSVHGATEEWHLKNTPIFCYNVDLGSLPKADTVLPDWMSIADIDCDTLILPRKGMRVLQFRTTIFSHNTSEEIAYGAYEIVYDNPDDGYMDIEDDIYQANALGVTLGLHFAACGGKKVNADAMKLIKRWAAGNLDSEHEPGKLALRLQKFFAKTIASVGVIEKIRVSEICKHINETAPLDVKCNILMLCMSTISTCKKISTRQIKLLKIAGRLLDIRTERLRSMIEDIRPFAMYEVKDLEICLGITSDMDEDQVRQQLSSEYRKWNSRVINTSSDIRDEAENMLELIGETKEELCV